MLQVVIAKGNRHDENLKLQTFTNVIRITTDGKKGLTLQFDNTEFPTKQLGIPNYTTDSFCLPGTWVYSVTPTSLIKESDKAVYDPFEDYPGNTFFGVN